MRVLGNFLRSLSIAQVEIFEIFQLYQNIYSCLSNWLSYGVFSLFLMVFLSVAECSYKQHGAVKTLLSFLSPSDCVSYVLVDTVIEGIVLSGSSGKNLLTNDFFYRGRNAEFSHLILSITLIRV